MYNQELQVDLSSPKFWGKLLIIIGFCFFFGGLLLRFLYEPDYFLGILVGPFVLIAGIIILLKKKKKSKEIF